MVVALVTCSELPDGDDDGAALVAALSALGVEARWQVWDAPAATWRHDLAVVRSTWDYTRDRDGFLAWTRSVPHLENPPDVIAWNSDKTYLRDLAEAGLPVVPTTFVAPGERVQLPATGEYVIKPSVGAGSMGVGRFASNADAAAQAHVTVLHDAGRTALVQPYLADIETAGETALIYIDGEYSHAIQKGAMLAPQAANPLGTLSSQRLYAYERIASRSASAAELDVGAQVTEVLRARLGAELLYARVDLLPTAAGPVLVELELTEPSLFLSYDPKAAHRLATAIAARA